MCLYLIPFVPVKFSWIGSISLINLIFLISILVSSQNSRVAQSHGDSNFDFRPFGNPHSLKLYNGFTLDVKKSRFSSNSELFFNVKNFPELVFVSTGFERFWRVEEEGRDDLWRWGVFMFRRLVKANQLFKKLCHKEGPKATQTL